MARQRKLSPERKELIDSLLEDYKPYGHDYRIRNGSDSYDTEANCRFGQ